VSFPLPRGIAPCGDVRVVAAVALHFVEHLQENLKDRVAPRLVAGLAVDVEQDGIGVRGDGPLDIAQDIGSATFFSKNSMPAAFGRCTRRSRCAGRSAGS